MSQSAAQTAPGRATGALRAKRETVMIPWAHITPDPDQPRDYFNAAAMEALQGSIDNSDQKLPIIVRPFQGESPLRYMVVDGERRWRSAKALDIPVECIVRNDLDEPFVRKRFQVLANFNRQGHTLVEEVKFLRAMLDDPEVQALEKKEAQYLVLGKWFGHTAVWVRQRLGLLRLHSSLFDRLGPGTPKSQRFPVSVAFRLSCVSHKVQLEWAEKLDTGKLNAARAKRQMANALLESGQEATGHRGRKPSDNIELFRTWLKHLRVNGDGLQEMDEKTFVRMIASRPVSERRAIKKQLSEAIQQLRDIMKRVEAVADNQVSGK